MNPEQEHAGTPLLVIAGTGMGKTNSLAHRTAQLLFKGAAPELAYCEQWLSVWFKKKAW